MARPRELFTAGYWADLVAEAERGLLDFVTIEDALGLQSSVPFAPDERTDQVRGRLDAVLIAARIAPLTRHIGLVPTAVATHTEPFHLSKAIATLDYVSSGRAGLRVQVSARGRTRPRTSAAARSPRSTATEDLDRPSPRLIAELFDEAADYVEVVRRLWDSWEDDAEIRDVATGRFIDRDKLHYIDFEGRYFSVKGPSITPRPPQGQPLVTALAHRTVPVPARRPARPTSATSPRTTPTRPRAIVAEIRAEQAAAGRAGETLHVFGDLVVFLDDDPGRRRGPPGPPRRPRRRRRTPATPAIFTGTPASWPTCSQELAAGRARPASGCGPAVAGHDLPADHPRPGPRAAAPRRLPHRLRGRHPARPARACPAPPTATPTA